MYMGCLTQDRLMLDFGHLELSLQDCYGVTRTDKENPEVQNSR